MQARSSVNARGVDVSNWQGQILWPQVRDDGIVFAFIKATEAKTYRDPQLQVNFVEAKAVGILRGAYHFARPASSSAHVQAQHFVSVLREQSDIGELPPVLDLEDAGGKSPKDLVSWVNQWIQEVEEALQRKPLIYVSPYFANSYLTQSIASVPLWVANWEVDRPQTMDTWTKWTFWQYTHKGQVKGISGNVDLDVYAGTIDGLQENWGNAAEGQQLPHRPNKSSEPPHPELRKGSRGVAVKDVQLILYRAGLHPGSVDGVFGANTLAAVRQFQSRVHIPADGIVGGITWAHLVMQRTVFRPLQRRGSRGQWVTDAQYLLAHWDVQRVVVDGIFGPNTEAGVQRFQQKVNILVDGIVGPQTWTHLLGPL